MIDRQLQAIANKYRRRVLLGLAGPGSDDGIPVPEGIPTGDQHPDAVAIELTHQHLPLLEEMGYIRWERNTDTDTDTDTQMVYKGPHFEEISQLLDILDDHIDDLLTLQSPDDSSSPQSDTDTTHLNGSDPKRTYSDERPSDDEGSER